MPILRQISSILVPVSACLSAKAICSSVNLLFFTACPLFQNVKYHAGFFTFKWLGFSGQDQFSFKIFKKYLLVMLTLKTKKVGKLDL